MDKTEQSVDARVVHLRTVEQLCEKTTDSSLAHPEQFAILKMTKLLDGPYIGPAEVDSPIPSLHRNQIQRLLFLYAMRCHLPQGPALMQAAHAT